MDLASPLVSENATVNQSPITCISGSALTSDWYRASHASENVVTGPPSPLACRGERRPIALDESQHEVVEHGRLLPGDRVSGVLDLRPPGTGDPSRPEPHHPWRREEVRIGRDEQR